MEKKKKEVKKKSGSLKVDPVVLETTKDICKKHGILIYHYATEALKERNEKFK